MRGAGRVRSVSLAACAGAALMFSTACSEGGGQATGDGPASGAENGTVLHLEGWSGTAASLRGEASYKVKRAKGGQETELQVEIENAPRGVKHALTLDGFELAVLTTDLDGEAEYEATSLPAGCPEPKAGSVLRVGELMELELLTLERELDLEASVAGSGSLSGKVSFRIDHLGDAVARELQVKVSGAPAGTVHPVSIGGVNLANLEIEEDGKGKLEFSTRKGEPFPATFVEPADGSAVQIGQLFTGKLSARKGGG